MLDERLGADVLQFAYCTGAHVYHLLVVVGNPLVHYALLYPPCHRLVEEAEQQPLGLLIRQDFQLVRVLNVHYLIADVVGGLHEIHEGVPGVCRQSVLPGLVYHPKVVGNFLEYLPLRVEEAELAVAAGEGRREGVFHYRGEGAVCHHEAAVSPALEPVGEQTEGVGVALETRYVVPQFGAYPLFKERPLPLGEESLYSLLPGVTEGRVPHVVGQARRAHYGAYLGEERVGEFRLPLRYCRRHVVAQRHSHARHLQAVCQAVMHEDAARQGEHLGLVLHPAEGRREDEAVVVALELAAVVVPLYVAVFLSQPFVGYELLPVHHKR